MVYLRLFSAFVFLFSATLSSAPLDRLHDDSRDTPKLLFRPDFETLEGAEPSEIALAFLEASTELFRLPELGQDLVPGEIRQSLTATHVSFRQQLHSIGVEGAKITISIDAKGEVSRVYNTLWPVAVEPEMVLSPIGSERSLDLAWQFMRVHGELLDMTPTSELLWVREGKEFRLIYKTMIHVAQPLGRWEVRLDARSGEVLAVRRTEISRRPLPGKLDFKAWTGPVLDREQEESRFLGRLVPETATETAVDGSATTFDPDPRTTLMDETLEDGSAAGAFAGAYVTRTLRDITETGGVYSLNGPWATISDHDPPTNAPSTTADGLWTAERGDNSFNDALVYFHLDQSQRYMQSMGFTGATGIQELSIAADSDGAGGADNSFYSPGANTLTFGHGCVDDSEDADVVLHEYGHAIQHSINANWTGGDTGAMGEGFADYWAGSYSFSTPNGPAFHPEWVFSWDGHNGCWPGRWMDRIAAMYDPGQTYGAHQGIPGGFQSDELWSTPLFQAFLELVGMGRSREEIDQVVLESHFGLGSGLRMPDMASATLDAAQALFPGGPHRGVFESHFVHHNILDLPELVAPSLIFPIGGEELLPESQQTITWANNGAPGDATYQVAVTDQCTAVVAFEDDMEGPSLWTATHGSGSVDWSLVGTDPHSGVQSWFASDLESVTDQYLELTSPIMVPSGAMLSVWHSFNTESGYDGGVIEISTNGADWTDLESQMLQNPYGGSISTCCSNPLGGRPAFSGDSGGYQETLVDLTPWVGQNVQIRFRMGTDSSVADEGWWVDDVSILVTGAWVPIGTSSPGGSSLAWTTPAQAGTDYCVRLFGQADGHSDSQLTQSNTFSILFSPEIFQDDFETGDSTAWSASSP